MRLNNILDKMSFKTIPKKYEVRLFSKELETITLFLTNRCNSRCTTCGLWKLNACEERKKEIWNSFNVRRILSSKYLKNIKSIYLTGGEPTLKEDFIDIINAIHETQPNITILFATNGIDVERTKSILDFIKDKDILHKIDFSMNGLEKSYSVLHGCKIGYQNILELIKFCKIKKMTFSLAHTIFPYNYQETENFMQLAKERNLEVNLGLSRYDHRYRLGEVTDKHCIWDEKSSKGIIPILKNVATKNLDYLNLYLLVTRLFKKRYVNFPCFALFKKIYIDPYGQVFPCDLLRDELCLGNVLNYGYDFDDFISSKIERFNEVWCSIIKKRCQPCLGICDLLYYIDLTLPKSTKLKLLMLKYPSFHDFYRMISKTILRLEGRN